VSNEGVAVGAVSLDSQEKFARANKARVVTERVENFSMHAAMDLAAGSREHVWESYHRCRKYIEK
jgi:hypothetical protein